MPPPKPSEGPPAYRAAGPTRHDLASESISHRLSMGRSLLRLPAMSSRDDVNELAPEARKKLASAEGRGFSSIRGSQVPSVADRKQCCFIGNVCPHDAMLQPPTCDAA